MDIISYSKAKKAEQLAQSVIDGEFDLGVARTAIDTKLTALETQYEPQLNDTKTRVSKIESNLSEQESQTQTLTHGLNVIESDQPSPMKVEFYGNTLVNGYGKKGNIYDENAVVGYKDAGIANIKAGKCYVAIRHNRVNIQSLRLVFGSDSTSFYLNTIQYHKFTKPADDTLKLQYYAQESGLAEAKVALYEVSEEIYNKIGVSLTDADVERMFPYVDSVQHVKNPAVQVSGANLLNESDYKTNYAAGLDDVVFTTGRYGYLVPVQPNTTYTISRSAIGESSYWICGFTDDYPVDRMKLSGYKRNDSGLSMTITSGAKSKYFYVTFGVGISPDVMFNLGTQPKPYVPYNPSYLYAETTLAGNDSKKDILRKNYSLDVPRWEVKREIYTGVLDGSLSMGFGADGNDFKRVYLRFNNSGLPSGVVESEKMVKYDGSIISNTTDITTVTTGDYSELRVPDELHVSISDIDSGWTNTMTPTSDMIKGYFNGWKYTGDGTTHSWVSIVDGSAPPTNTIDYVKANQANGYKNYFLSYQLAKPVIEVEGIDFPYVEGDLAISGDAQVEVGSGVIVRERVNIVMGGSYHYINSDVEGFRLKYKPKKFIAVYEDGKLFTHYIYDPLTGYGGRLAIIKEYYNPDAEYTVTYEVLDKHAITTNINEVKATYQNSMKSSFQSVVSKQSDIATDLSINKRSIIDLYAKLKALEV